MADKKCLSLQEEELLSEEVQFFPCLYDRTQKSYKEKDVVRNAWNSVAEKLEFIENGKICIQNFRYQLFSLYTCVSGLFRTDAIFILGFRD